jgi:enoyl-CoA hydratase/carnithine racemase
VVVRFERSGAVARITLDRPEALNAIDPETHRDLLSAWTRFRDDSELRVAILRGEGPKAFCSGIDLKRLPDFYAESRPGERLERWAHAPGIGGLTRNFDAGKPILAAVHGHCLGLGLELALACDLRVASEDARFGLPELTWGILPGQGGTQRLPRTVPPSVALEMILTGRPIDARRAYEVGLVNRVVPRAELDAAAEALAGAIAERPPDAVRLAREAVRRGLALADELRGGAALATVGGRFPPRATVAATRREGRRGRRALRQPARRAARRAPSAA